MHLEWSPNTKIDKKIWDRYRNLPIAGCKIQATYVWIDGTGENLRSKSKTMDYTPSSYKDCPTWDFDGSSTGLAETHSSDVLLCPVALYADPITQGNNKIVLCDTYNAEGKPTRTNFRHACMEALNQICDKDPMFGLEQEYQLMDLNNRPFGWPVMNGEPAPAGPYYCGVGADKAYGREIVESHYRACLYSGLDVSGVNAEVTPSQWEFQTGPTIGIKAADDLWMARYLLHRIAEDYGVAVSLHPKLFPNWNGAGCHANFSTKEMREDGGYKLIEEAVKKLEKNHAKHIKAYDPSGGEYNKLRLTGHHETSSVEKFSWGVADRSVSVRINRKVAQKQKGYLEDRRPSSNSDPYQVINALVRTICLNE
ncbi:Gln-synt C domain containing protein [Asbolus verrucosus]|uniref:glutamine synthetase n=1 Tax=Asbolus verrucosus TaxID=1661398 RepID=A0A482VZH3_ASBVE|nr:Gln-synt C domain containing protein [Asbolus verrucosus]